MITKKKRLVKIMLVISFVLVFDSIGTIAEIGPRGLLSFAEWMIGGSYLLAFFYANWDLLIAKK